MLGDGLTGPFPKRPGRWPTIGWLFPVTPPLRPTAGKPLVGGRPELPCEPAEEPLASESFILRVPLGELAVSGDAERSTI